MQTSDSLVQPDEHDSYDPYTSTNKKRKLANVEDGQDAMIDKIPAQDSFATTGGSQAFADSSEDVHCAGDIDMSRTQAVANETVNSQHPLAGSLNDASVSAGPGDVVNTASESEAMDMLREDAGNRSPVPSSVAAVSQSTAPSPHKQSHSKSGSKSQQLARELRDLLDNSTGTNSTPRGYTKGAVSVVSSSPVNARYQGDIISMSRPKKEDGYHAGDSTSSETGGMEMEVASQVDAHEAPGKAKAKAKSSGGTKKLSTTKTKNASMAPPLSGEPYDPPFTLSAKLKKSSKSKVPEDPNKVYTEEELAAKAAAFAKKSASSKLAWERKKAAPAAYEGISPPPSQALAVNTSQSQRELSLPSQVGDAALFDEASNDGSDTAFNPSASKQSKASKNKASAAKGQAKPSNKSKKKKAASPAASDASSIPMLALHSADGTVSNFDDARVNLGASQSKRNGKSQLQQQQLAPTPPLSEEEEQEIDDRLYCICQDLYDPERIMIACDRCDEWYHIACIGLSEEIVDLVGRFICPACEAATGEKTTYRAPCARKECTKAVMKHSKYCSDWCGLTVAASRLELQQDQIDPAKLWKAVEGFQRQEAFVTVLLPDGSVPVHAAKSSAYNTAQELDSLSNSLDQLVAKRMSVEAQHSVVNYRLRYLRLALQRWQHSCAAFKETNPVQPTKKSKSKSGATASAADGPCGFDVRLVWDDKDFADWVDSEGGRRVFAASDNQEDETQAEVFAIETVTEQEEGLVCSLSRKKCDRHTGWQKMREADYEVEKSVLNRRLQDLAKKERQLRRRVEDISDLLRWQTERSNKASQGVTIPSQHSPAPSITLDTPNIDTIDIEMAVEAQDEDANGVIAEGT